MVVDPNVTPAGMPVQSAIQFSVQSVHAARAVAASSLASALVAASNRPHSPAEVHAIYLDFFMLLFPEPQNGRYQEWLKTKDQKMNVVHQ